MWVVLDFFRFPTEDAWPVFVHLMYRTVFLEGTGCLQLRSKTYESSGIEEEIIEASVGFKTVMPLCKSPWAPVTDKYRQALELADSTRSWGMPWH